MTDASKEPDWVKQYFYHWGHRYRVDKGTTGASKD